MTYLTIKTPIEVINCKKSLDNFYNTTHLDTNNINIAIIEFVFSICQDVSNEAGIEYWREEVMQQFQSDEQMYATYDEIYNMVGERIGCGNIDELDEELQDNLKDNILSLFDTPIQGLVLAMMWLYEYNNLFSKTVSIESLTNQYIALKVH